MILSVGLVCVDVIYEVDGYPVEDSDQRVLGKRSALGGNEANICQVVNNLYLSNFNFQLCTEAWKLSLPKSLKHHYLPTSHNYLRMDPGVIRTRSGLRISGSLGYGPTEWICYQAFRRASDQIPQLSEILSHRASKLGHRDQQTQWKQDNTTFQPR